MPLPVELIYSVFKKPGVSKNTSKMFYKCAAVDARKRIVIFLSNIHSIQTTQLQSYYQFVVVLTTCRYKYFSLLFKPSIYN